MKILVEQITDLLKKKETLRKNEASLLSVKKENHKYSLHYEATDYDTQLLGTELAEIQKQLKTIDTILQTSEIVTEFDNEKINIGTVFEVQLSDSAEVESFTLIEDTATGSFNSTKGYITIKGAFGKSVLGKAVGENFSFRVKDDVVVGKILNIIEKDALSQEVIQYFEKHIGYPKKEKKETVKTKEREIIFTPSTTKSPTSLYSNYRKKLMESSTKEAEEELKRLESITFSQREYLRKYLNELRSKKLKAMSNSILETQIARYMGFISSTLSKNTLEPVVFDRSDLGQSIILEVKRHDGIQYLQESELIVHSYGHEDEKGMLPIQNRLGFGAYHAKMGETFQLKKTATQPGLFVHVAQFGIDRKKLLIPTSANIDSLSPQEKQQSNFREEYQQIYHPIMTQSQKNLLDLELSKISLSPVETHYISRLLALKEMVENGDIPVQTNEELFLQDDRIGLGSQVSYMTLDNQVRETELISCAFTTETKDKYTEISSPLGTQLMGKQKNDMFSFNYQGSNVSGVILSVENEAPQKNLGGYIYTQVR